MWLIYHTRSRRKSFATDFLIVIEVLSVCLQLFSAFIWCKYTKKWEVDYHISTRSSARLNQIIASIVLKILSLFFVPSYNKTNNTESQISRKSLIKFQCWSWDYPSFCSGVIRKSFAQKKVKKVSLSSMKAEENERIKKSFVIIDLKAFSRCLEWSSGWNLYTIEVIRVELDKLNWGISFWTFWCHRTFKRLFWSCS